MSSPTQRSKKLLESQGYLVAITEHWNQYARRRLDLFNFIDLVAIRGDETVGVQTTSDSNVSARISKIKLIPAAKFWAQSPTRKIIVHGWGLKGAAGKRKKYECRAVELKAEDFEA
jgi:hypothetical protein